MALFKFIYLLTYFGVSRRWYKPDTIDQWDSGWQWSRTCSGSQIHL